MTAQHPLVKDEAAARIRFEAERQALALMDHPNIAKVLDAGTIMVDGGRLNAPWGRTARHRRGCPSRWGIKTMRDVMPDSGDSIRVEHWQAHVRRLVPDVFMSADLLVVLRKPETEL
jgi:hypothetical protein